MVFYYETNIFLSQKFAVFSFVKNSLVKYRVHNGTGTQHRVAEDQGTLLSSTKLTASEYIHHKPVRITLFCSRKLAKQIRKWSILHGLFRNLQIKCRKTAELTQDRVSEM
jgi:hypothetical protein